MSGPLYWQCTTNVQAPIRRGGPVYGQITGYRYSGQRGRYLMTAYSTSPLAILLVTPPITPLVGRGAARAAPLAASAFSISVSGRSGSRNGEDHPSGGLVPQAYREPTS